MGTRRDLEILLALGGGVLLAATAPAWSAPLEDLRAVRVEQRMGALVPAEAAFRDETGRAVKLGDYLGQGPLVVSMVYYECPNLCTFVLNGEVKAFQALPFRLGEHFTALTVSIDPTEGPRLAWAKRATYLRRYGRAVKDGWHFLTGDASASRSLADALGLHYVYEPESHQYAHPSALVVLTPQGRVSRYFYGIEYDPRDLRLALVEAGGGRIGTPIDQVLLRCFHYDPAVGRYGLRVVRIMQLMALVTLIAVIVLVLGFLRRERRRRQPRPPA